MSLLEQLAKKLDDDIIENFADIYEMNGTLNGIAKKHDLDVPQVIAAIATCADIPCAQERLIARPAAKLVVGLELCLDECKLRPSAKLLVDALLDGARRERDGTAAKLAGKPLPAFARPVRLPPPVDAEGMAATQAEVETLVRAIASADGEAPETSYTPDSLAQLGRALALGWLSHCAEPKHAWGARAAGYFPDDATARDLGMLAAELGPRVGQFAKAVVLVDALEQMGTRAALEQLHVLATKIKTKSVKDRAKTAFDAAAKRSGISKHDLADKLIPDDVEAGKPLPEIAKRMELRMVDGTTMALTELVENILQKDAVRAKARGIVFAVTVRSRPVTFAIADRGFVGIDGEPYMPPATAITVVHPLDLTETQLDTWRELVGEQPFAQLDRRVQAFANVRAMVKHVRERVITGETVTQGKLFALEAIGWHRAELIGGSFARVTRELGGITANVDFRPGIALSRGMAARQSITNITAKGKGKPRAMAELAREIETLCA